MFGKLENGILIPAPATLTRDGLVYYNPGAALYAEAGYRPVVETPYPETEEENPVYYAAEWQERDGAIVRVWAETEPPVAEPTPPTLQELDERLTIVEERQNLTEADQTEALNLLGVNVDG